MALRFPVRRHRMRCGLFFTVDTFQPSKPKAKPRRGCHRCKARPAPGTPYIGSACEGCAYAESRQIGHGRVLSIEAAGRENRIGEQGGGMTFDGETIAPAVAEETNELLPVALDGDEEAADIASDPRRDAFLAFLMELASMTLTVRESVFGLLSRKPLHDIAKPLGITFQAVGQAQQTALRHLPVLRALLARGNRR